MIFNSKLCKITEMGCQKICEALTELKNLTSLELDFS